MVKAKFEKAVPEPETPTVISLLEISAKIAETQGMKAWEIMDTINQVLHFPLAVEFRDLQQD